MKQAKEQKVVGLDNDDLAIIVNGTADDALKDRPFDQYFTPENIRSCWRKVGFCPFTRECLDSGKLRHELGQSDPNKRLEDLQQSYDEYAAKIEAAGFNPVFNKQIPRAAKVQRKETTEEQIDEIVDKKASFLD